MSTQRTMVEERTPRRRVAPNAGEPRLVAIWEGGTAVLPWALNTPLSIGRCATSALQIAHASVSRRHAEITITHEGVFIEDFGSANGTCIGGERLLEGASKEVPSGYLIQLGEAVLVVHGRDERWQADSEGPCSSPLESVYDLADRIAPSKVPIVILGETGAGKELLARHIHAQSGRAEASFVALNCGTLSGSLLESELFGHEPGAFTDARRAKPGLIELAHEGTLFLDEIGDLPKAAQVKLLRVLENGETKRLGSTVTRHIDARLIAATNRDLSALVEAGEFRADLYFRLCGVVLELPPLRDRQAEIEALANGFLEESAVSVGKPAPAISSEALMLLQRYAFPGNVRELKHAMECASLLCSGPAVLPRHLPARMRGQPAPEPFSLRGDLSRIERQRIVDALESCAGNQSRAATLLGMPRRTFISKLERYELPRPRKHRRSSA